MSGKTHGLFRDRLGHPFHQSGGPGPLRHRAHRGGRIVQELDHRGTAMHLDHAPDQPDAAAVQVHPGALGALVVALAAQDLVKTALVSVDAAYGEMVKGTQQMMAAATEALNAGLRLSATAPAKPLARRGG